MEAEASPGAGGASEGEAGASRGAAERAAAEAALEAVLCGGAAALEDALTWLQAQPGEARVLRFRLFALRLSKKR